MRAQGYEIDDEASTDFTSVLDDQRVLALSGEDLLDPPKASMVLLIKGLKSWPGHLLTPLKFNLIKNYMFSYS